MCQKIPCSTDPIVAAVKLWRLLNYGAVDSLMAFLTLWRVNCCFNVSEVGGQANSTPTAQAGLSRSAYCFSPCIVLPIPFFIIRPMSGLKINARGPSKSTVCVAIV